MSDWIEIRAELDERPADWSIYVDAFTNHNCPGTLESGNSLTAYLANVEGATSIVEALKADLLALGVPRVTTAEVPDQDWSELWKIHFKPRRVGHRFVIVPTWETYESKPDDRVITLDPGQAFGTGDHPTTRLCLALMETVDHEGRAVLDVGCGSGVLAIGAKLLGASSVKATDIDPQAVAITRENATLNGVTLEAEAADGLAEGEPAYDIVLSNIISATLIRLSSSAARTVKAGGAWIVSGIIRANWPDVQKAAEAAGFTLQIAEEEDDWVGAIFRR